MLDRPILPNPELAKAAMAGLSARPKRMSPKWFYDERGSALFEAITALPEYYPTRVEAGILSERAPEIGALAGEGAALVEFGSGASAKTRRLLDAMPDLAIYAPLDISADFLAATAGALRRDYPALRVTPITADFMKPITLPAEIAAADKVLFFPGSTIGNLERAEAVDFLARLRRWTSVSAFVLGADLVKDADILIRAYDDAAGVTAAFNKNLLARLNREASADFDLDAFAHEARWNAAEARIEMHLVATAAQSVCLGNRGFHFARGESLHTENSHKYTRASLEALADATGWRIDEFWTDAGENFAVLLLRPAGA